MKVKLFGIFGVLFFIVLLLCPARGNCDDTIEKFKTLMIYAYSQGYTTGSCDKVSSISKEAALDVIIKNPRMAPEGIMSIKSAIKVLDDCCHLGKLDRQSGECNLLELLDRLEIKTAI